MVLDAYMGMSRWDPSRVLSSLDALHRGDYSRRPSLAAGRHPGPPRKIALSIVWVRPQGPRAVRLALPGVRQVIGPFDLRAVLVE